jgi:hypothetical protein
MLILLVPLGLATSRLTLRVLPCEFGVQMGMGKTACAVGAIQLNRPPEDWRKNRSYQTLRARDHLCKWKCEGTCLKTFAVARSCSCMQVLEATIDFWLLLPPACYHLHTPAASVVNNMPHGGTLIIVPASLVEQWCGTCLHAAASSEAQPAALLLCVPARNKDRRLCHPCMVIG